MIEMLENLKELRQQIIADKGQPTLLAAVQREEAGEFWDLLIAAQWAVSSDRRVREYLVRQLKKTLSRQQFMDLSGIHILKPSSPFLRSVLERFDVRDDDVVNLVQARIADVDIKRGYILAAHKRNGLRRPRPSANRSKTRARSAA